MTISNNINTLQTNQNSMNNLANEKDLTKSIPQQISLEKDQEANATTIRTQDDMMGTLLDMKV